MEDKVLLIDKTEFSNEADDAGGTNGAALMGELEGAMEVFLMFALMTTTLGEVNYPEGEMSLLNYTYADGR